MSFMESVKTCYGKYARFAGRAQRSEYWWFILFYWLVTMVLYGWMFMVMSQRDMTDMVANGSLQAGMDFDFPVVPGILLLVFIFGNNIAKYFCGGKAFTRYKSHRLVVLDIYSSARRDSVTYFHDPQRHRRRKQLRC